MRLLLLAFLVVVVCKDVCAGTDTGLYDPIAPAGSSFVRFLNLDDQGAIPKIGKKKYTVLESGQVSAYFPIPEGSVIASMAGKKAEITLKAGLCYTIVNKGEIVTLQDQVNTNRSKLIIAFYNFSDRGALSLKVRKGTIDVLTDVGKNKTSSREMNAVKIDFSVFDGEVNLISLDEAVLERGNHYSIIYNGKTARIITATTNTRK